MSPFGGIFTTHKLVPAAAEISRRHGEHSKFDPAGFSIVAPPLTLWRTFRVAVGVVLFSAPLLGLALPSRPSWKNRFVFRFLGRAPVLVEPKREL